MKHPMEPPIGALAVWSLVIAIVCIVHGECIRRLERRISALESALRVTASQRETSPTFQP